MDEKQNIYPAKMAGIIRSQSELWPAVGDYVLGSPQPGDWILIEEVLERTSLLARKDPGGNRPQILAANVDVLFIVTAANADLNLNRLERYVAMAEGGNVRPVIVVNKIELAADPHALLDQVAARFSEVDVTGTSAMEGWNLDSLEEYVQGGLTAALVGSSGVGKSTLTNFLLGRQVMETQAIREDDDRGRHTTTHRELHITPSGAIVIDTPGLRQIAITDEIGLASAFSDIEKLATRCKFGDCAHATEPGCAVQAALESGELSAERWENFNKLLREVAFEQRKGDKALQAAEKKKWAKIHMAVRQKMKIRKGV